VTPVKGQSNPKSLEERVLKARTLDGGAVVAVSLMEAAARLRVGRSTMQRLVRERKVKSVKIGRVLRIPVASIEAFIEKGEKGEKSGKR
jgi:excisionase family DNA binding protein